MYSTRLFNAGSGSKVCIGFGGNLKELTMTEEDIVNSLFYLLRQNEEGSCLKNPLDQLSFSAWDELLNTSLRSGVAPLLYERIKRKSYVNQIPVYILDVLKQAYLINAAKNLIARKQLNEILYILEVNQIPVILLKGSTLAFTVYDNPACRTMSDLDIMVQESDIPKVLTSLGQAGYQMSKPAWETPGHHLPPLVKPGIYLPVEVHWLLTNPNKTKNLPADAVWNTIETTFLNDRKFLSLSPTLLLFYMATHASYHHRFINGIQAICDIERLVLSYRDNLNLPAFLGFSELTGCTKGTLLVLKLSLELLNAELPYEFNEYISRFDFPETVVKSACHSMITVEDLPDTPSKGKFSVARWWLEKAIKYSHSVKLLQHRTVNGTVTNQSPRDFINQFIRLSLSNISAAINYVKTKNPSDEIENYRSLRDWLDNS
jgi:hypothetical protein